MIRTALFIISFSPILLQSQFNCVMTVDGSGGFFAGPASVFNPAAHQDFTIEFWMNWDQEDGNFRRILTSGSPASAAGYLIALDHDNHLHIHFFHPTADQVFASSKQIRAGQWTHLALVYDCQQETRSWGYGTKTLKLYINGKLDLSEQLSAYVPSTQIGWTVLHDADFTGQIDEIRLWYSSRSPGDIQSDMFTQLQGKEPHLAVLYNFSDNCQGVVPIIDDAPWLGWQQGDTLGAPEYYYEDNLYMAAGHLATVGELRVQNNSFDHPRTFYPNPAKDELLIVHQRYEPSQQVVIRRFDGRPVLSIRSDRGKINIRHLAAGMYTISIPTDTGHSHHPLIITK